MADEECEHDWRVGPSASDPFLWRFQVVCLKCWTFDTMTELSARCWPKWTEDDYWNNLDVIEGDKAPEIRRMAGRL